MISTELLFNLFNLTNDFLYFIKLVCSVTSDLLFSLQHA